MSRTVSTLSGAKRRIAALTKQVADLQDKLASADRELRISRYQRDEAREKVSTAEARSERLRSDLAVMTSRAEIAERRIGSYQRRAITAETIASLLQDRLHPERSLLPWEMTKAGPSRQQGEQE